MIIKRKLLLTVTITLLILFRIENSIADDSKFKLLNFGLTERVTTQTSFSGENFSLLPSWNPYFILNESTNLNGQLGMTRMSSNHGYFNAFRAQAGVSKTGLFNQQYFFPELLIGFEHWAVDAGGTYFTGSFNTHYKLSLKEKYLQYFDSIHIGYQMISGAPESAKQYTLGVRTSI